MTLRRRCLVWLPHSYAGLGPAESCVRILEHFSDAGIEPVLFICRARAPVPPTIDVKEALGGPLRNVPYRAVSGVANRRLERLFQQAIEQAGPGSIAYFWPDAPTGLVEYARAQGLICVREMINSPLAHAKPILDKAYRAAGLSSQHGITDAMVEEENRELRLYDFVFSSNAQVDAALADLGIDNRRILKSTFGWVKDRFGEGDKQEGASTRKEFRAAFVGLMNVRKGVPTLLEAWGKAGIEGELLLAGTVEDCLQPMVRRYCTRPDITELGQVSDVAALYRSCDAFVFPTHEEGGPQVTYEAAACGIPVVTTKMGAARLVEDGVSGLLCKAGDPDGLAIALRKLASDRPLAARLARNAYAAVDRFEYGTVGTKRAELLLEAADGFEDVSGRGA